MRWIALQLPPEEVEATGWCWWALRFTPRVARHSAGHTANPGDVLLLEISACERLWGGRARLLRLFLKQNPLGAPVPWAQGATSLVAMALLRLRCRGEGPPVELPAGLPLDTLEAAREHLPTLSRTGCNTWGALRALPRGGVSRRFGAALLEALDQAWGERPESHAWLALPEVFDQRVELPALATSAPELVWSAGRLLTQLQVWLQGRQRGVLAFELEWTLDLKRLNGKVLPSHEQMAIRTAQPTQDMAHLRRLLGEHLARATLGAPVNHLRLRSLETETWGAANTSLLPEDQPRGDRLHELVERLSARLGPDQVLVPRAESDHRPERMQRWVVAREAPKSLKPAVKAARLPAGSPALPSDALYPPWLLPEPEQLDVRQGRPFHGGVPLHRMARLYRVEAGWWEEGGPAVRDYFVARSEEAGLVWIFRERPQRPAEQAVSEFRWYLQGLYA